MAKRISLISKSIGLLLVAALLPASAALAVPIINLGPVTPAQGGFLVYNKGEFQTIGSTGKDQPQPTTIDFDGDLAGMTDILSGRLTLDGILGFGQASLNNGVVQQTTKGGSFSLYGDADSTNLLLSGTINTGYLGGQLNSHEASFTTWEVNVTGGSLKTAYWDKMIDLRIDMGNLDDCIIISKRCFISGLGAPLPGANGAISLGADGTLQSFRANLVDGFINAKGGTTPPTDVPEPASALLMLLGGAYYPVKRRLARS